MTTEIHTGDVHVTAEPHSPRPDHAPGWEETAEISCQSPSGRLLVTSFMDDTADLPSLASDGPGSYRLRVHARGRDRAVDQTTVDAVVESYLIQSRPAAHQDALLMKATDTYGPRCAPSRLATPSSSTTRTHRTHPPARNATSCTGRNAATTPDPRSCAPVGWGGTAAPTEEHCCRPGRTTARREDGPPPAPGRRRPSMERTVRPVRRSEAAGAAPAAQQGLDAIGPCDGSMLVAERPAGNVSPNGALGTDNAPGR